MFLFWLFIFIAIGLSEVIVGDYEAFQHQKEGTFCWDDNYKRKKH